jgi:hypothetical protein
MVILQNSTVIVLMSNGLLQVYGDYRTDNGQDQYALNNWQLFYTTGSYGNTRKWCNSWPSNDCNSNCSSSIVVPVAGQIKEVHTATIGTGQSNRGAKCNYARIRYYRTKPTRQWQFSSSAGGSYANVSGVEYSFLYTIRFNCYNLVSSKIYI